MLMIPFFTSMRMSGLALISFTDASPLNENVTDFVEFHIEMDFP